MTIHATSSDGRPSPARAQRPRFASDRRGLSSSEHVVLFTLLCVGAIAAWKGLSRDVARQVDAGTRTFDAQLRAAMQQSRNPAAARSGAAKPPAVKPTAVPPSPPAPRAEPTAEGGAPRPASQSGRVVDSSASREMANSAAGLAEALPTPEEIAPAGVPIEADDGTQAEQMKHCAVPRMNKQGRWYCEKESVLPNRKNP